MKRLAVVVVGLVLALGVPGSASARPVDLGPGQWVDAVVVLTSQADLGTIRAGKRADRLAAVERTLRDHAARTQQGLLGLLLRRRAQGLVTQVRPLWIANEVQVRAAPSVIAELASRPDVRAVRPNETIQAPAPALASAATEANVARVNAPAMWDQGFRGQGIVVANMDTGVDATHPDLAGRWRGGTNSWYDPNGQHSTPVDVNGHGTQTMGVMVGGDAGGTAIGMAPDARWIAVKIFNDRGAATTAGIHLGFQWLLDPDGNPATPDAPNVVNNSWTMSTASCNLEFQPDLRGLRAAGILPVFAAGNDGPTAGTVLSPANNPEAFAVGGTDNGDALYPYSSRGPSACAGTVAPKLAAPGVDVRSSAAGGGYYVASGTSLSAPHVSGALALLLSAAGGLAPERQEAALQNGAVDLGPAGPDSDFGYGRLDVAAAYSWLATAPDFAVAASPASAGTTPGGAVSYAVSVAGVNGFAGDVSLSLAGLSASQASWSFTPPVVTGGAGAAQLDVRTTTGIAPGSYPLTLTGTSGGVSRSASVRLVVSPPPDFGISVTPSSRTANAGTSASYTVTTTALNGFTADVALSLTGLPASVGTATFTPAAVHGAGSSALSIATAATAPAGSYPLTVTGTSGSTTHSAPITLVVPPRDFGVAASPASVTISRGQTATYTVSVSSSGGFAGNVTLSVTGLPRGASVTFSRNPVPAPGTATVKVKTTATAARGTFTLTVTGKNGGLVRQTTVTLVIR